MTTPSQPHSYEHDDLGFSAPYSSRHHPRHHTKSGQMMKSDNTNQQAGAMQPFSQTSTMSPFGSMWPDMWPTSLWPTSLMERFPTQMIDIDILEAPDKYVLQADLPGCRKDDVNISLQNGMLTISAHRQNNVEQSDNREGYVWRRVERSQGSVSRSMRVPADADVAKLQQAVFDNGTLKLELPKFPNQQRLNQPTKIPIL